LLRFFLSPEAAAAVFFPASFFSAGAFPAGAFPAVVGFFSALGGIIKWFVVFGGYGRLCGDVSDRVDGESRWEWEGADTYTRQASNKDQQKINKIIFCVCIVNWGKARAFVFFVLITRLVNNKWISLKRNINIPPSQQIKTNKQMIQNKNNHDPHTHRRSPNNFFS
jgi:hypothetical protein